MRFFDAERIKFKRVKMSFITRYYESERKCFILLSDCFPKQRVFCASGESCVDGLE